MERPGSAPYVAAMDTTRRFRRWSRAAVPLGLTLMAGLTTSACGDGDDAVAATTVTSTTVGEQPASVPPREDLAAAAPDDVDDELLLDPETEITVVPADFLSDWVLLRVYEYRSAHGRLVHLAYGDGQAWTVTQPEDFDAMVEADGTGVADAAVAEQLVRTRLEVTRPSGGFARVVESVDDLELPGGLDADEEADRDEAFAELDGVVAPPAVDEAETGWTVTLYVQRTCESDEPVAEVTREVAQVQPDGQVDLRSEPVADFPGPVCVP